MTETEKNIPFGAIDPKGRFKFVSMLEMLQEAADEDASKYGLSVRQTLEHGVTWVLRKYRIDLTRYPVKEDSAIAVRTYAEPYRNLFSLRTFILRNIHGEPIGSAYTWWLLIDVLRSRIIRLDKCEIVSPLMERISDELPRDVAVPDVTDVTVDDLWKVRWQDLDINNHANHTAYFGWALDTVPHEVPEEMAPMSVEGEFLLPIPRIRVRCVSQEVELTGGRKFFHSLRHPDDGVEYARLSSVWK